MRAVCCILIAFLGTSAADICSWCSCTKIGDYIPFVECKCQDKDHESLVLEQADMKNLTNVQKLTITSCSSVVLKSKAFTELRTLDTLVIDTAKDVIIGSEMFNTLSFLMLNHVENLTLHEKSLQNVKNLSNILIKDTKIVMVPQDSISNLPELMELKFQQVALGEVRKGAIQLPTSKSASVVFDFSDIGHIEEGGIVCSSINELSLINTKVKSAAINSTSIVAHSAVNITGSTLESNVRSDSYHLTSRSVFVSGNTFSHFPGGLLPEMSMTVSFSNNVVLEPNWDLTQVKSLVNITSFGNRFTCKCSNKERLNSEKGPAELQSWLDQNYCHSCKLPLRKLPETCEKVSNKDNMICNEVKEGASTVAATPFNYTTKRYTHFTSSYSTSAPRAKSVTSRNGCETFLTPTLLTIALSSLIFTIL